MKISATSLTLPILLDLLEREYAWQEIIATPSLLELHGWSKETLIYPYQLGGSGLIEKLVGELSPFMGYVYKNLVDYMQSYIPSIDEAIQEYRALPQWAMHRYPKKMYREFTVEMGYVENWLEWDKYLEVWIGGEYLSYCEIDGRIISINQKEQ